MPAENGQSDRIWDQLREMENRMTARFDRLAVDAADRHLSNTERLSKLEQFYWQSIGVGRIVRAFWGIVGAIAGAVGSAVLLRFLR